MFAITGSEIKKTWPANADTKIGQPGEDAELGNELPCDLGTITTIAPRTDTPGENDVNHGDYKFVQYDPDANGDHPSTGDVVSYKGANGFRDNVVTGDNSDSGDVGAGVVAAFTTEIAQAGATQGARTRGTVTLDPGEYLWIQVKGPCQIRNALGATPADGDALEVSDTDFTLQRRGSDSQRAQVAIATDASDRRVVLDFAA